MIEDERVLRSIVLDLLTEEGYAVITSVDGMDAPEKADKYDGTIDLLLLSDVEMPRMTGVACHANFSKEAEYENTADVGTAFRIASTQRRLAVPTVTIHAGDASAEDRTHFKQDAKVSPLPFK